ALELHHDTVCGLAVGDAQASDVRRLGIRAAEGDDGHCFYGCKPLAERRERNGTLERVDETPARHQPRGCGSSASAQALGDRRLLVVHHCWAYLYLLASRLTRPGHNRMLHAESIR